MGNAQDFGDLLQGNIASQAGFSNPTRGIFAGGYNPALNNIIEYVTILSTGNGIDFGDLSETRAYLAGCSNGHGGL